MLPALTTGSVPPGYGVTKPGDGVVDDGDVLGHRRSVGRNAGRVDRRRRLTRQPTEAERRSRVSTSRNGWITWNDRPVVARCGRRREVAGDIDHDIGDRQQVEVDRAVGADRHDDEVGADVAERRWC